MGAGAQGKRQEVQALAIDQGLGLGLLETDSAFTIAFDDHGDVDQDENERHDDE